MGTTVDDTNAHEQERLLFWTVAGPLALLAMVIGGVAAIFGWVGMRLLRRSGADVRSPAP